MTQLNTEKKQLSRKTIIIVISVVVLMIIEAVVLYFSYIKPEHEKALNLYSKTLQEYNVTGSKFDAMCEQFEKANNELLKEITDLQDVVTYGGKPYDENVIIIANDAINQGKIAQQELPKVDIEREVKQLDEFFLLQVNSIMKEDELVKEKIELLNGILSDTKVPDYAKVIEVIDLSQTELEDSIRQLKQVTAPSESFVLSRITEIKDEAGMVDIIALTEDTDTNNLIGKSGWYTSKIIFKHKDVNHYGLESGYLTLAEVGNPAGGCIETYTTVEDAERRNQELTDMEGTVRSPGDHFVCGTMVVRVSEDMKTSTQKILLEMIVNSLLRLDD